jgi:hypothetical protein
MNDITGKLVDDMLAMTPEAVIKLARDLCEAADQRGPEARRSMLELSYALQAVAKKQFSNVQPRKQHVVIEKGIDSREGFGNL